MLRHLFFLIPVLVFLASCAGKKKEVTYLNNELTTINDSLFYKGQAWGEEFKIGYNTGDFSQLQPARAELQAYIEQSIARIKNMEDVGGSEDFRKTELQYLEFERNTIITRMSKFEQFTDSTSPEEVAAAYAELLSTSQQEQQKLEALRQVQKAYADKNEIELKESSLSHIK